MRIFGKKVNLLVVIIVGATIIKLIPVVFGIIGDLYSSYREAYSLSLYKEAEFRKSLKEKFITKRDERREERETRRNERKARRINRELNGQEPQKDTLVLTSEEIHSFDN